MSCAISRSGGVASLIRLAAALRVSDRLGVPLAERPAPRGAAAVPTPSRQDAPGEPPGGFAARVTEARLAIAAVISALALTAFRSAGRGWPVTRSSTIVDRARVTPVTVSQRSSRSVVCVNGLRRRSKYAALIVVALIAPVCWCGFATPAERIAIDIAHAVTPDRDITDSRRQEFPPANAPRHRIHASGPLHSPGIGRCRVNSRRVSAG